MTLLRSHHLSEVDWDSYDEKDYGSKVEGLKNLPQSWTPPYVVIPTEYFHSWTQSESLDLQSARRILPSKRINESVEDVLELWREMSPSPETQLVQPQTQNEVVVRSSVLAQNLNYRGGFLSEECPSDIGDIEKSVFKVWKHASQTFGSDIDNGVLGVIVQPKVPLSAFGHLSNERRVSRISTNWSIEWESEPSKRHESYTRFSTLQGDPADDTQALTAPSQEAVEQKLRQIAVWSQGEEYRVHYEWVWGGSTLWLVQRDIQQIEEKNEPGSKWPHNHPSSFSPDFDIFDSTRTSENQWAKTECLEVFQQCGLNCPDIYLLKGENLRTHLDDGKISDSLKKEIDELLEAPVVVRTDVVTDDNEPIEVFSPRSETLMESDEVVEFIINTHGKFQNRGYKPSEFCFLIHHFMVSRSSALARSSPDNPMVSVDSIWGIPDGLNCYPHDSFRVNMDNEEIDFRETRCKDRYLDVNSDGEWVERVAGKPWDWKTSMSDEQLFSVAEKARTISKNVGEPVVVMFFVDLNIGSKLGKSIPWFFWPAEEQEGELSSSWNHWSKNTFTVRTEDELDNLQQKKSELRGEKDVAIEFNPGPDYVRETTFVEEVADLAESLDIPILLDGSLLSHAYYILKRSDARVQTTFEANQPSNTMRFSKLVRDKIPIKIESGGEEARTYEVASDDIVDLLKAKAVEEALEFSSTEQSKAEAEELADLFEIIRSYADAVDSSMDEIKTIADQKRREKGGFSDGIVLISTHDHGPVQDTLEREEETRQPSLPTPFFPDPKVKNDLNPKKRRKREDNPVIEAPLIPPSVRGLEGITTFELSELNIDVKLEYGDDKLSIMFEEEESNPSPTDQTKLDNF